MASMKRMGMTALLAILPATAALVGCDMLPRHLPVSLDRHVYESTVSLPTTVSVVEPYSGEVLWSMAVPVEHKLTLDFNRKGEIEPANVAGHPATSMNWRLAGEKKDSGKVVLPGTPVGMKISYRPSPEFPPGKEPASLQPTLEPVTPDLPQAPAEAAEEPALPADSAPIDDAAPVLEDAEDDMTDDAAPVPAPTPIEETDPADAAQNK